MDENGGFFTVIRIIAKIVEMNFYYKISFNKYIYKSNFHIICDFLPNYLSMIGLMFPHSDPLIYTSTVPLF